MNLFSELINLGPEDISTAILSYILKDGNRFSSFQKLFFNRTIEQIRNTSDLRADIFPQKEYSGGIPDITIITTDLLLLIENKLVSSLSGDNQLIRYVKIFDDVLNKENIEAQQRMLVLLCPSNLMQHIQIISDRECRRLYETSFSDHCIKSNVIFRCISWGDVISDLDKSDNIQSELYNYISEL